MVAASGSIDDQASFLAAAVAPGGQAALAPLLAAYAAAGIPVIGGDGQPLPGFEADQVGPGWWQVWLSAGGNPQFAISLTDATRILQVAIPTGSALDSDEVAATALGDLREMASAADPHERFFARFLTDLSTARSGADALAGTTAPSDVQLSPIALEFYMAGLLRSLMAAVVATDPGSVAVSASKIASIGVPLPPVDAGTAQDAPATNPCNPTGDAEAVSYWAQWIASKLMGGLQLPGMENALKGTVQLIIKNAELAKSAGKAAAIAGGAISALSFLLQYATLTASFDVSPNPLVRTHADHPHGGEATITTHLTYDLAGSSLDGGVGIKNCLLVMLNALGIQASLPVNGAVEGAKLTFEGRDGFGERANTADAFVQFPDQVQISGDTGTDGLRTIRVQGIQQKKTIADSAREWSGVGRVRFIAQPEPENGRSLASTFWDSLVAEGAGPVGFVAPLVDVMKTVQYDLGEYSFLVTDWRQGLITQGHFGALEFKGEKCDGLDGDWVVQSTVDSTTAKLLYRIAIDEKTGQGTYTSESSNEPLPGFVTLTNNNGNAFIAAQPDGTVIMTLVATKTTVTTTLNGASQTVEVAPAADTLFSWLPGGDCSNA